MSCLLSYSLAVTMLVLCLMVLHVRLCLLVLLLLLLHAVMQGRLDGGQDEGSHKEIVLPGGVLHGPIDRTYPKQHKCLILKSYVRIDTDYAH